MINTELYDTILFIHHFMFLSDVCEDAYHFICKKYSYARYKFMNRLLSFKNDLVIVNIHLLLGLKMPYLPNYIFCYECTFRSHDKLFLYIINTQNKWKTTSLYYILYIQGKTTQRKPTQREGVFDTKPPGAKTWSARNHPDSVETFD